MRKPTHRATPRVEAMEPRSLLSSLTPTLTTSMLEEVFDGVERVVLNLARTQDVSRASARLTALASRIPDGAQQLAPVWQRELVGFQPGLPGAPRAEARQLVDDLKRDIAAGVVLGELRLVGPGAAAFLRSALATQASADRVTILNRTGFSISVSATLNNTGRSLPARTIANNTPSAFDFGTSTNQFIAITVSPTTGNQVPPLINHILNRPITGYNGAQFTISVFAGRFSVSSP